MLAVRQGRFGDIAGDLQFWLVAQPHQFVNASQSAAAVSGAGRITSYNVCYTKLLRNLADGVLAPYIKKTSEFFFGQGRYLPGLGMVAGILVIYIAGIIGTNVLGNRLVNYGDYLVSRIPLVKSIYSSSKQIINVFSKSGRESFRRAVYVEFPMEGSS